MAIVRRQQEGERGLSRAHGWDPFDVMREMMKWEPFRELTALGAEAGAFAPSFEVKETKDAFVFKADLPGVKESDLELSLTGNRLTVSGQRREEKRDEGETYYAFERRFGTFSRTFTLPEGVDAEHIDGELKDGVLQVVVPKRPEVQAKRIQLKGATEGEKKAKA